MSRVLLLCFIHGFKGTDNTFKEFPEHLQHHVGKQLPDHHVESVVYPKYETKGELEQATEAFVEWLKERVIDCRQRHFNNPWPPVDRKVGVILVAHSMGGFVAADALFLTLNERAAKGVPNEGDENDIAPFPLIQGILTFDTPYNGLARSMFVYGAFSNYSKVSGVFNAMTALSAAAPATFARLGSRAAATTRAASSGSRLSRSPAWTTWQLVAVRTGTVGAIAAGGVAAYVHREAIMKGVKSIRNLNKDSVIDGYHQGMDAIGQGLAYINRGNVGKSFAWLADHFTFVGALMKQKELSRRLERLAAVKGVGVHDFYCSLGENGYWSGGYFVPERTFCAVPEEDHAAYPIFERRVMRESDDEIKAHMSIFKPEKHKGYDIMMEKSAQLICAWFLNEAPIVDEPALREGAPDEKEEDKVVDEALEKVEKETEAVEEGEELGQKEEGGDALPDESPIDIAAAAALVPLPGSEGDLVDSADTDDKQTDEKRTYLQHLFRVAEQAGSGAKTWWPAKVPAVPSSLPKVPNLPNVSSAISSLGQVSMPQVSMPSVNLFGKKDGSPAKKTEEEKTVSPIVEGDPANTDSSAQKTAQETSKPSQE
ncbi:unnamed protein product [Clonostachys byssicola]|uniref:DUF676 domain-containing protein n=1 Tax=Clonostachys byssicola TaxID=160290 RepID=A0A9N9UKK6_9HYPO|nr:unnamed protein product [Clonostachys byssicola]